MIKKEYRRHSARGQKEKIRFALGFEEREAFLQ